MDFRAESSHTGGMKVSSAAIGLKKLRERSGMSVREVAAALERPASSYASYEDKFKKPFLPMELASALVPIFGPKGITRGEILKLAGLEMTSANSTNLEVNLPTKISRALPDQGGTVPEIPVTNVTRGAEPLEVRGMAEGGQDGWNLWNGEVVQVINRPDNLIGVKGAYGVLIRGTSMLPRYDPNMIAHVHPWQEVGPGDYVVVQRKPMQEGEPPLAVVKRLVRRTASKLILEQLNPPERFEVPAGQVISIHMIVGSSRA